MVSVKELLKYFVVGVLGLCVGMGSMFLYEKVLKREPASEPVHEEKPSGEKQEQEEKKENALRLVKTSNVEDKIVQEYEMVLNDKRVYFNVSYLLEKNGDNYNIKGSIDGYQVYHALLKESVRPSSEAFKVEEIDKTFSIDNFKFVNGRDKKGYLAVRSYEYSVETGRAERIFVDIYNNEMARITENSLVYAEYTPVCLEIENNVKPWYSDEYESFKDGSSCYIRGKVTEDAIYNLVQVGSILEERTYTINAGKLDYTILRKYNIKTNI